MVKLNGKKVLAFVLAVMMVLGLAACGASSENSSNASSDSSKVDLKLISDGKLIMGTNAEFPPFEYMENGKISGVDVSIMTKIAEKLGLTLEIKNLEFDSLPEEIKTGKIDVIAAGFTAKPDREEVMDFSDSYYTAKQTVIVKADSSFTKIDDLKNKKIGVQKGTTGYYCAEEYTTEENIKGYGNGSLAVEDLIAGNLDAVIIDNNPAEEYATQHDGKIKLIEDQFDEEYYVIGIAKGNKDLTDAINGVIADMKSDGSLQTILDEFIK